jgi:hypothetical protein
LDDRPLVFLGEVFPAGIEVAGFGDHLFGREVLDPKEVDLSLEPGNLPFELDPSFLKGGVPLAEAAWGKFARAIEAVELVGFFLQALRFFFEAEEEFALRRDLSLGLVEAGRDLLRGEEEVSQFPVEDPLQIHPGHLVPAVLADVLRRVRGYVHLPAAVTEGEPREEMHRPPGGADFALPHQSDHRVCRVPDLFRDDRLHLHRDPLVRRLQDPLLAIAEALRIVREAGALRGRVADQTLDRRMGEGAPVPCAVPPVIEELRDREEAPVFQKEVIHEAADGSLLGVWDEAFVLPLVAEGSRPAGRLPELRADGHGGRHPLGDLLPLPGGHAGDQGIEEAAGGGRGVDRFLKGDEVGALRLEELGEVEEFFGVPRQAGELREDQPRDPPGRDVFHHPAGLGVGHHGFAGDALKVVDRDYRPSFGCRIHPGAVLVVLGALAFGLVLGRDPNPDRDVFYVFTSANFQLGSCRLPPLDSLAHSSFSPALESSFF